MLKCGRGWVVHRRGPVGLYTKVDNHVVAQEAKGKAVEAISVFCLCCADAIKVRC